MNITSQHGDMLECRKVKGRSLAPDRSIISIYNNNLILNTLYYDVEFTDGQIREYTANIIAENMLTWVNDNGFESLYLDAIIDYAKDSNAVDIKDKYYIDKDNKHHL